MYRFYNTGHPGYPDNLPSPPNFEKLQQFFIACIEETLRQKNAENSPDAGKQNDMPPEAMARRPMSP